MNGRHRHRWVENLTTTSLYDVRRCRVCGTHRYRPYFQRFSGKWRRWTFRECRREIQGLNCGKPDRKPAW